MGEGVVRSILVINVSRIGDTLLATPAVRAIATAYPSAQLTCLGHPKRMEILKNLPFVARADAITKNSARWLGRFGRRTYDLAFVYGNDRALIEYALRVAHRVVAFRQHEAALNVRLHKAVEPPPPRSVHAVMAQLALPAALDIAPAGYALAYRVTVDEDQWAKDILRHSLPGGAMPLIGLQVASFPTKGYRDWPIEGFIALCERLLERNPRTHLLIFGGALERERTEQLHRRFAANSSLYAGRLSLRQTAALMKQLDLYIGVDTGPTHIMGTLGIPLVVLYHCHSPSRLLAPLEHPCLYTVDHPRSGGDCGPETPMDEILVDTVWSRVLEALAYKRQDKKAEQCGGVSMCRRATGER